MSDLQSTTPLTLDAVRVKTRILHQTSEGGFAFAIRRANID